MRTWNWTAFLLSMSGVLFTAGIAWAQQTPATQPDSDPKMVVKAAEAEYVKEQVVRLKMLMRTVAANLKDQPEVAAALQKAAEEVDARKLIDVVTDVIANMKKNMTGEAYRKQQTVVTTMEEILETLRNGRPLDKRTLDDLIAARAAVNELIGKQITAGLSQGMVNHSEEMNAKMAAAMAEIKAIAAAQETLLTETANLGEGDAGLKKLGELIAKLEKLIEAQKNLREKTDKDEIGKLAYDGEMQRVLQKTAQETAGEIADAARDPKVASALKKNDADPKALDTASASTKAAAGNMKSAADGLSKSTSKDANQAGQDQDQALNNLEKAKQALTGALAKAGGKTPADGIAGRQDGLKTRLDAVNQTIKDISAATGEPTDTAKAQGAAGDMAKASDNLKGQDPKAAIGNMKDALAKLNGEDARKLAALSRKVAQMTKADPKNADQQAQIAQRADEIARLLAQKNEKNPNGMPGKESMGKATKSAQNAADKIKNGGGKGGQSAQDDQGDAQKNMEKTRQALDEVIDESHREEQDQTIAKIIDMLTKMLETQVAASGDTKALDGKRSEGKAWTRPEELTVAKLSSKEGQLGDESIKIIKMLTDEGTTAVFPRILKQVETDLRDVQNMLGEKQTGELTQSIQGSVEKNIQGMIEALKAVREENRKRPKGNPPPSGNPNGDPGGKKEPLVPPVAELKMLKALQLNINDRTVTVAAAKERSVLPAETVRTQHEKLSARQKEVETMTIELKTKMQQGGH